jgi:hypothetical protein
MSCHALLRVCSLFLLLTSFFCDCAWGSQLSLEEYRSSIQDTLSSVESEKGPLKSEECALFEEHFPSHLDVNTKSGEAVQVDNGSLLRLVKESQETEQGREALIAHLKALRSQISFVDQAVPLSEDRWSESRARLEKVFSTKEFQDLEEVKDPAWMAFLSELLKKVIDWVSRHGGAIQSSGKWMEYVFYGVILGGVFLLVLWILRSFGPVGWRFRDLKVKSDLERKASGMDWQALREESRHKGEKGAYREAIRLYFISVLMEGHERGWWVYRREATNREHLSGVEGSTERREALGKMIQVYENAWYGHESAGEEALLRCAEWLRLIEVG